MTATMTGGELRPCRCGARTWVDRDAVAWKCRACSARCDYETMRTAYDPGRFGVCPVCREGYRVPPGVKGPTPPCAACEVKP